MAKSTGLKRFFAPFQQAITDFPFPYTLTEAQQLHYLRTVLRSKAGESMVLVDGERRIAYLAKLEALEKHTAQLIVEAPFEVDDNSGITALPKVILAAALIKEHRWDWLLQKATELGVDAIQPLLAERSVVQLAEKDLEKKRSRWQGILQAAAEQSEGLFIPQIHALMSVKSWCQASNLGSSQRNVLLAERGEQRESLKTVLAQTPSDSAICLAIGPEGGWTSQELASFESAGYAMAHLGHRILRSETAAVAAMSAVVYQFAV